METIVVVTPTTEATANAATTLARIFVRRAGQAPGSNDEYGSA
ncbi:MAG: hypothetical protein ABSF84_00340 [Acidimicrobiales bacterium]|jgi:hypothetical protein